MLNSQRIKSGESGHALMIRGELGDCRGIAMAENTVKGIERDRDIEGKSGKACKGQWKGRKTHTSLLDSEQTCLHAGGL